MNDSMIGSTLHLVVAREDDTVRITAHDDDGSTIGTATFDAAAAPHPATFSIAVTPAERGRGVGTALFGRLLDEAAELGVEWLTCTGPADDELLRLAATSGSVCARRVRGDIAKAVFLVPHRPAA
jgi:GNAT superfamily N-acetyltransferase